MNDNIGVTEINEILLNSVPNIWYRRAYVHTFKKAVNMFEHMEISESIYECVVEPSYKKTNRADDNSVGHIRQNIGEAVSSWTRLEKG